MLVHVAAHLSDLFLLFVTVASTVDTTSAPNVFDNAVPNMARYGARKRRLTQMSTGSFQYRQIHRKRLSKFQ